VLIRARKFPYGVTNAHFAVVSAPARASKAVVASKYLLAVERFGAGDCDRRHLQAN
jgi:hypothetical protein